MGSSKENFRYQIIVMVITMVISVIGTGITAWVTDYFGLKEEEELEIKREIVEDYEGRMQEMVEKYEAENRELKQEFKTMILIMKEGMSRNQDLTNEAIEIITDSTTLVTQHELDSIYNEMRNQ